MKRSKAACRKGMALVGMMLVLMVVLSIMLIGTIGQGTGNSGVMTTSMNAVHMSGARSYSVAAFNMAESGIDVTIQWLSSLPSPPVPPIYSNGAFAPALWGYTEVGSPARAQVIPNPADPTNYFTVEVYPDSSNTTNTQKKYMIESVGYSGGMQQIVRAYVEQTSLSKWLVLLNSWSPSNNYWVAGLSTFDGPVHDNVADGQPENDLWLNTPGSQLFSYSGDDAYSVSGPTINWYEDNYWTAGAPQTTSDWADVAAGGAESVQTGTATVPFPPTSVLQETAALGGTTAPTNVGVAVPNKNGSTLGGVYIHGDVDNMTLSVNPQVPSTQIIDVSQTDPSTGNVIDTNITISPTTNQTTVVTTITPPSGIAETPTTATYTGVTNGVVYSDGNIGSQGSPLTGGLQGVVADNVVDSSGNITQRSSLTIATAATANLNLVGNVTYNTARQRDSNGNYLPESTDTNFTEHAGILGIISNQVMLDQNDNDDNPITKFEMDGSVLAYTRYDADNYGGRAVGTWENMGSYLSSIVGVFGEFDGNNDLVSGFNTQFNYDARMRDTPPPYYPTTGNQYDIVSWQRVASTLQ